MALKAILASLDGIDDAIKALYVEKDGKFVLDVEPVDGFALEDVNGLKTALGKERTTRERLERDVVKFKDLDPDKAREALAKLEELTSIDPAKEADKIANTKFEAAKAQLLEKHKAELTAHAGKISSLEGLVDQLARKQEAIAAIAEHKGSVDLLLPHVLNITKSEVTDEGVKVKVLQPDGNDRVNGKGEPMSIRELVAEMRQSDVYGPAFEGSGQSGSGKQPGNGGTGGTQQRGNFGGTKEERAAAIAAKFPELKG